MSGSDEEGLIVSTALVLGCNGQDGTFLCKRLLNAGQYQVVGVGLEPQPRLSCDAARFRYVPLDLAGSSSALGELLAATRPERVFHVAAVHASATDNAYEPLFESMLAVNVRTVHTVLEHLRTADPAARLIYASSSKVFGAVLPPRVSEDTPRASACLYGVTKNTAGDLIRYYRRVHGALASQLFLFNHESQFRPAEFFIPKLVRCLLAATHGEAFRESFHTLDFHCDWGSADEYMGLMIEVLERAPGEDFVLATGRTVHAKTLIKNLFTARSLPTTGIVQAGAETASPRYEVDISKLRSIGLYPTVAIEDLIERLVRSASSRD